MHASSQHQSNLIISALTKVHLRSIVLFISCLLSYCSLAFAAQDVYPNVDPNNAVKLSLKTLGISQIVQHPALDAVREGMLAYLKEEGYIEGTNLTIFYENAQGNISTSAQIASKLISSTIDVGVAISTPSAQTLFFAAEKQGSKIPIVYTAVSDPAAAKLESKTYPITGVLDVPDLEGLLELIHALLPSIKTLGILYNPSETNSASTVTYLKKLLQDHGIKIQAVTVNKTTDVSQAMHSLIGKVDALYFPQDNTVVAAIETVVHIANHTSPNLSGILPIFANDTALVKKGVLAAIGYDYADVGRATGRVVSQIFKGEDPQHIPLQHPEYLKTLINGELARKLSLKIPSTLQRSRVEVIN